MISIEEGHTKQSSSDGLNEDIQDSKGEGRRKSGKNGSNFNDSKRKKGNPNQKQSYNARPRPSLIQMVPILI